MEPTVINVLLALGFCGLLIAVINKLSEDYGDDLPPTWPFY